MYEVGDHLLMVATDRISAYDLVLGSAIPDKGSVLTQLSAFWFGRTGDIVPNHMISTNPAEYPAELQQDADMLAGRSMLVRRTKPVPIECVARGYLAGSGWKEYQKSGRVCGVELPGGLRESDRLPQPIFTPATKAESGHDINISEDEAANIIGRPLVTQLRDLTLALYAHGAAHAESCGIIVADTKFEFGLVEAADGDQVVLIDEALTPPTRPGSGHRTSTCQASRNRASTSSSCEIISTASSGTGARRFRSCRPTWWNELVRNTSKRIAC